jgi:3-hydroxyacyl-CoA dehydrogenase/enoyl-CoA hydratase/3-hydroxybutyryl-CoA epimerase
LDRLGIPEVVEQLREYAEKYGERFTPPALLVQMAEKGESFFEQV